MPIGKEPRSFRLPSMSEILTVSRSRGRNSEAPHLWDGLVGAWPMQEGRGDKVYDASGYGNNASMAQADQATKWGTSPRGHALTFDGTDDYLDTGAEWPVHTWPRVSVSVWCFPVEANDDILFSMYVDNFDAGWYGLYSDSLQRIRCTVSTQTGGSVASQSPNSSILLDTWSHTSMVFDDSELILYVNAAESDRDTGGPIDPDPLPGGTTFHIGSGVTGATSWNGGIQNVVVHNRALSPSEVQELYERPWAMYRSRPVQVMGTVVEEEATTALVGVAPKSFRLPSMSEILTVSRSRGRNSEAPNLWKGLVGAWPMQEGRGDKVYDASGRGNTGTLTNMDPATDWITGPIGRGLEFDSTVDDYVDLGNPYYGPDMSGLTVSLWLRPSDGNNRIIIGDGAAWDTGTFFVNVKGLDDKYEFLIYGANYDNVDSATIVSTTQWSHFCGIWAAGERVEIYHNGVLDSDVGSRGGSAQNSLQVAGTTLQLGRRPGDTSIDPSCVTASLAIYDRALTPSEIQELYERPWSMHRSRPVQVMGGVVEEEATTALVGVAPKSFRLPSMSEILSVSRSRGRNSEAPHLWDGLIGAWPMQEGRGDTLHDVSGRRNSSAVMAQADQATKYEVAKHGRGLAFDGTDDGVSISSVPSLVGKKQFALSLWMMTSSNAGDEVLMEHSTDYNSNTGSWLIYKNAADDLYMSWRGYNGGYIVDGIPDDGVWRHYLFNLDFLAPNLTLGWQVWIDGVEASITETDDFGGTDGPADLPIYLGSRAVSSLEADVSLSNFQIFDHLLNENEVSQLYERPWSMYRSRPVQVMGGVAAGGTDVTATLATISLAANAATVKVDTSFTCSLETLALAANNATVKVNTDIDCSLGAIALAANATTVQTDESISCSLETLALAANNATVKVDTDIGCSLGAIALVANAATVQTDESITCSLEALALAANNATVKVDTDIDCSLATLALAANNATVSTGTDVNATLATIAVAANNATVNVATSFTCSLGVLSLAANNATVSTGTDITATLATIAVAANAATVKVDTSFTCTLGTIAVASNAAEVSVGTEINVALATISLTANAATVSAAIAVDCTLGTLSLEAFNPVVSAGLVEVDVTLGTISVVANNATVLAETSFTCTLGTITVVANNASVITGNINCTLGELTLAANAATVTLEFNYTATLGTIALTAYPVNVGITVPVSLGAITVAANSPVVLTGHPVFATLGTITLAANNATVKEDIDVNVTLGAVTVTANNAIVRYNQLVNCTLATITLAGNNATVVENAGLECQVSLGAITLTPNQATIEVDTSFTCSLATISLAANNASVAHGVHVPGTLAVASLAGNNATISGVWIIDCSNVAITLSGHNCTIDGTVPDYQYISGDSVIRSTIGTTSLISV